MNDYYSDVNSFEERSARRRAENWGRRYNQAGFRPHKHNITDHSLTRTIRSVDDPWEYPQKQNYQAWKSPKGKAYQGLGEGELNSQGSLLEKLAVINCIL